MSGKQVGDACREEEAASLTACAVGGCDAERVTLSLGRISRPVDPPQGRVALKLRSSRGGDLTGLDAVLPKEAMRGVRKAVAALAGVDHQHRPASAQELKGGCHPGVAAAYDNHIVAHGIGPFGRSSAWRRENRPRDRPE
jgi:hypothetical protein